MGKLQLESRFSFEFVPYCVSALNQRSSEPGIHF